VLLGLVMMMLMMTMINGAEEGGARIARGDAAARMRAQAQRRQGREIRNVTAEDIQRHKNSNKFRPTSEGCDCECELDGYPAMCYIINWEDPIPQWYPEPDLQQTANCDQQGPDCCPSDCIAWWLQPSTNFCCIEFGCDCE